MLKKIMAISVLSTGLVVGKFNDEYEKFNYEYKVVLNSNSINDILDGYTYKEYLIDEYNNLINHLDPSLHQDAVINNIDNFAKDGSKAFYEGGSIVIYVGDANGEVIKGELKRDSCDTSTVRVRFYFSKFFFK
jgi:hypothetical protein